MPTGYSDPAHVSKKFQFHDKRSSKTAQSKRLSKYQEVTNLYAK